MTKKCEISKKRHRQQPQREAKTKSDPKQPQKDFKLPQRGTKNKKKDKRNTK